MESTVRERELVERASHGHASPSPRRRVFVVDFIRERRRKEKESQNRGPNYPILGNYPPSGTGIYLDSQERSKST